MGTVGVRIGEASNPGPPRTRARARMEREAEVALTGLEAAITRIDDSSDDEPLMPIVHSWAKFQTFATCGHVWVRVTQPSFQHCWIHWDQTSLRIRFQKTWAVILMMNAVRHAQSFVWGEMEDIGDDEVPEWGVTCPLSRAEPQGGPTRHSQRETVAASSLPDGVDSAHIVGDVEGVVVAIRGPTDEACDRWAFPVDCSAHQENQEASD